jgi:hypothetical protein
MDADKPVTPEGQPPEGAQPPAAGEAAPAAERKPIPEEMVARLRAGARKRRPWTAATWVILFILLAVPAGLLAWIFWPRSPPVPLVLTAYDQVGERGQAVVCRARLETRDPARADVDLAGREVTFEQIAFALPREQKAKLKVATQAGGLAEAEWVVPEKLPQIEFTARHVEADQRDETSDKGRLFGWPRATKVLLVDVTALARAGDQLWQQTVRDQPLHAGAATALRAAQSAKFAVAYLATEPQRAVRYHQVRNWIERSAVGPKGIPDGPVLGRLSVGGSGSAADLAKAVVEHLKRFDGPLVVLAGQEQTAEAYRAAGARVLRLGRGGLTWNNVAKELAK